ncbi:MAG: hypothetical protein AAF628_03655 [Planctomycetota bacterium]
MPMRIVAVLAGGSSPEHDVSLQSGANVVRALPPPWRPWPVYVDRRGQWWFGPSPPDLSKAHAADPFQRVGGGELPGAALASMLQAGLHAVFPALHGPFGEDGRVQGMLELHGVPCVGADSAASAVAMDKIRTRECLQAAAVPMPAGLVMPSGPAAAAAAVHETVGLPCFLKVDVSGSTLGVVRAGRREQVEQFVAEHARPGRRLLAEAEVRGEEISVPVLGNRDDELQVLPAIGIYPRQADHFTYEAKYDPAACDEQIPPRGVDAPALAAAAALAERCHRALRCDGMSRTDMIVDEAGPKVLEVNTIPGLTQVSLLPQCAAAAGIEFPALLARLLDLAVARAAAAEGPRP